MKHFRHLFMLLALLVMGVSNVFAQNVTIRPTTGNLVSAVGDDGQTGFKVGLNSLWRHEQLALSLTSADEDDMTSTGELAKPAAALGTYTYPDGSKRLIIVGGHRQTYLTVSLPKGYRITGYKLVLVNDLVNVDIAPGKTDCDPEYHNLNSTSTGYMRFYETKAWETNGTEITVPGTNYWSNPDPLGSEVITQAMSGSDGDINTSADKGKEYTIERTSNTDTDMGNQLYFRLTKNNYNYYGLSIKSFEIWFTAEGTFETDVVPDVVNQEHARSVVQSPFKTNKIDIGKLESQAQSDGGPSYYSYNFTNVDDLIAYTYLYQEAAVEDGKPTEVESVTPHITPVLVDGKPQYALENDVYYVETPVQIDTKSGYPAPIGYRIVGATFNYLWGSKTEGGNVTMPQACQITYTYRDGNRNRTVYLNNQLHFTRNTFTWQMDDLGNIYTGSGENIKYLSCYGEDEIRTLSFSAVASGAEAKWNLRRAADGEIYYKDSHNNYFYLQGTTSTSATPNVTQGATSNLARSTTSNNHQITLPSFNPGSYTLKVYDKTGEALAKQENGEDAVFEVNGASDAGSFELKGLNNDAVRFEIVGLKPDVQNNKTQALVSVELQLQALDPYINSMNIVCTDTPKELQMTQTFTANDFRVSGGEFKFYVPSKYNGQDINLQFSDLRSDYADETYPRGTNMHYSRYSFVTSSYFDKVDGYNDNGLYNNSNYSPDATYTNKIVTSKAGNIRFAFNNAEKLSNTGDGEKPEYLIEKPFSVFDYLGSLDPDAEGEPVKTGQFLPCTVKAGTESTAELGTFYVFTADETRYNIAPTTAWQHRAYAFYRMDIKVVAKDYDPVFAWEKLYDKTFFGEGNDISKMKTDSQWGLTVTTKDSKTGEDVVGYLTYEDIINIIPNGRDAVGTEGEEGYIPAIPVQLDPTNENAPASMDQILYIDFSGILSMNKSSVGEGNNKTTIDENTLKKKIGKNAVIFLPKNATSEADNVAYKTESGSYNAGKNIVIADRFPFYSPYDIQVTTANMAMHDRTVTNQALYGDDEQHLTMVLPFDINVNNSGIHTNNDGTGTQFMLSTMEKSNSLSKNNSNNSDDFYADGYFNIITEKSEPNKPYVVTMLGSGKESTFKAHINGALVKATPNKKGVFTNETASGTYKYKEGNVDKSENYSFTHTGTYTGIEIGKDGGAANADQKVFYFGNNFFLDSKTLGSRSLKVLPFRSYYQYSGPVNAKLSRFRIVFGDNPDMSETNGITDVQRDADLAVIPGKGVITLMARAEKDVTIHAVSGITVDKCSLNAGETRTVAVPAGVYVINGVKMVVK